MRYPTPQALARINTAATTTPTTTTAAATPKPTAEPTTRLVKFLVISDTHDLGLTDDTSSAFRLPTPSADVILHCGDLTNNGTHESLSKVLRMLGSMPAELKLVIAGNHDISLDPELYATQGGDAKDSAKALELMRGPLAQECGVTYLDEGTHTFTLRSGASFSVYASPYTPQYGSSAFQYPSGHDRFNVHTPAWATNVGTAASIIPDGIDIVMTHGPPQYVLDDTDDGRSAGCEHLRRAVARAKPRLHCFGHVHRGYGAGRIRFDERGSDDEELGPLQKEWVGVNQSRKKGFAALSPSSAEAFREDKSQGLMVNAAIMAGEGKPVNAPWLVELELETAERVGE
ncbi:uncharacterized protein K452DRAFT_351743 [Aplosporella prunicola CBS 121167]|uniref:Calcineurin-like phosphoesterase domain-containing protein n=1 Tax=Aplosporella prunicola CBS 121167 TaxID=1176127 RepID=A0A6A6BC01_9PEZI|nr:uncharacterized protein K452DRAFT_351743 [Aplosporella prunicola CBS 121167]KAF2141138.1 hypothetical protein K452DRAFT_351743 [Aplosporella prunicola CBS 121167]